MADAKKCKRCGVVKELAEFQFITGKSSGTYYRGTCKLCRSSEYISRTIDQPRVCRHCKRELPPSKYPFSRLRSERPLCLDCKPVEIRNPDRILVEGKLYQCETCHEFRPADDYLLNRITVDISYVRKRCHICHRAQALQAFRERQEKQGQVPRKPVDPELVAEEYWHARNVLGMNHGKAITWLTKGGYAKTEEGVAICLQKQGIA